MSAQTNSLSCLPFSTYHLRAVAVVIEVNFSIGRCLLRVSQSFLLINVALFVEVGEKEQEHNAVKTNPDHEAFRVLALSPQQLELMDKDGNELNLMGETRRTTLIRIGAG